MRRLSTDGDLISIKGAFPMLLRFRFSNVRSFWEEQELSLVAAPLSEKPETLRHPAGVKEGVLPVAAIYGANASGKTNVLKALEFARNAIEDSHRLWKPEGGIPREAFLLNEESEKEPSRFVFDFILEGVRRQYGFVVDSHVVRQEWLFVYPNGKRQAWFSREVGKPISFSAKMLGENKTTGSLTRPNSLFLSAAAQNNHDFLTPIYRWFSDDLWCLSSKRSVLTGTIANLLKDEEYRRKVSRLLVKADLGITEISVRQELALNSVTTVSALMKMNASDMPRLEFLHKADAKAVTFSLEQESAGTLAFLGLMFPIITALDDSGLIAIDELDANLHPLLALKIIEWFNRPEDNPHGAQLIFTSHDTNLFRALRRDQIWFTEKQPDGATCLYPLSDFKPRKDENLSNGYLQGRFGAIPFISADDFAGVFETADVEK